MTMEERICARDEF